jgi:hypothetical protein
MQSSHSVAATIETVEVPFRVNPADHPDLDNIVVSPCGSYIVSFDYQGHHHVIDWDELVGDPDEEEIPHEQVMAELDQHIEELLARRGVDR